METYRVKGVAVMYAGVTTIFEEFSDLNINVQPDETLEDAIINYFLDKNEPILTVHITESQINQE